MFNWLKGKRTYIVATVKFIGGVALAALVEDPYAKVAGAYFAVDALNDMTTRAGIADKVDEERLANKVIAWMVKKAGK